MNKLEILALLALVAFAATAVSGFEEDSDDDSRYDYGLIRMDPEETALMIGHEKMFVDFCLEQRKFLIEDKKNHARQQSANLFSQFFASINEFADDLLSVERSAVSELAKQIEDPSLPVNDAPMPENQVQALIERGKKEIQEKAGVSYGILPGAKAALSAMFTTINSAFFIKLAQARSYVSAKTLMNNIEKNCVRVSNYERILSENLEKTKKEFTEATSDSPDIQEFLKTVSINSLHCQSTKKIVRMNAFCDLFNAGGESFMKMLGLSMPK